MSVKKNDKIIKDVLKEFVHQKKISPGYYNSKVVEIWKLKMGSSINRYTREIKLIKNYLYLKIDSAPLKHELLMGKEKLIQLLNNELGENIIKDINIK